MNGTFKIPLYGIDRQYQSLREEILDVTDKVIKTGKVLEGPETAAFRDSMSQTCYREFALPVGSGTQALIFALRAIKDARPPGAKFNVLIPGVSFVATLNAVLEVGGKPIYADVTDEGLMDVMQISSSMDIHAILYVNLYGNIIDYNRLKMINDFFGKSVPVVEDAAQSFGATYNTIPSGKLADISCLSFDPTKNFNNYGSGGMVLTDDATYYSRMADYRDNGKFLGNMNSGTNSKMSEVDCAQMLVKKDYFWDWQKRRISIAGYYNQELENTYVRCPKHEDNIVHAWSKYVIQSYKRNALSDKLSRAGIETKIPYSMALSNHHAALTLFPLNATATLPQSNMHCQTILSLPIYPELTDSEVEYIVESVRHAVSPRL